MSASTTGRPRCAAAISGWIELPPPEVFLSPKGLQHVGPRAFGYDIEFRSVFA